MRTIKPLLLVLALVCGFESSAAYGIKSKPDDTNAVASAYLVPENAFMLKMRQPDGKMRLFTRDFSQPNLLFGDEPWVGEDMGGGAYRIITNPEFKGGRTGFIFVNGHLRRMVLGRRNYMYEIGPYRFAVTNDVDALWPKEISKEDAGEMYGTWANDRHQRLSLWFRNPNKAGCLLAEIVLLTLFVAFLRRPVFRIAGAVCFVAAFYFMLRTESRGAFVALAAAVAAAGALSVRRWFSWRRVLVGLGVLLVGLAAVFATGLGDRFTTKLVDVSGGSDSLRVTLMENAPRMMVDSPSGWGFGVSGRAYTTWYQDIREFRFIRTLVNSHLTWLVEMGWVGRLFYLAAITALLLLLAQAVWGGAPAVALAEFSLLTFAGCFNSVLEAWELWVIPLIALVALAVRGRSFLHRRPALVSAGAGLGFAALLLVAFGFAGSRNRVAPAIRGNGEAVVVGSGAPAVWVLDDGAVLGGGLIGRELRLYYGQEPESPAMGVVWELANLPADADTVVVAGRKAKDFLAAFAENPARFDAIKSLLFISPPFTAAALPENLVKGRKVRVLQGELLRTHLADAKDASGLSIEVPGCELYVPGWMKYALEFSKTEFPQTPKNKE